MKKMVIILACIVMPLTVNAGFGSLISKGIKNAAESTPTKVDNFAPASIHKIELPESQILSEIAPASQLLSESPYKLDADLMSEASNLANQGYGEVIQKADTEWYFVPNPAAFIPDQNLAEEPENWTITTYIVAVVLGLFVLWWFYSAIRGIWLRWNRAMKGIAKWLNR